MKGDGGEREMMRRCSHLKGKEVYRIRGGGGGGRRRKFAELKDGCVQNEGGVQN
jgi:hypothetical protein